MCNFRVSLDTLYLHLTVYWMTIHRDVTAALSDGLGKSVIVVDTSNEIAGGRLWVGVLDHNESLYLNDEINFYITIPMRCLVL